MRSYARTFPAIFTRAVGTEIWDGDGRRYLDFLAGAGSLNYGHNDPPLKEALLSYVEGDGIAHSLDLHTSAKQRFLETFDSTILRPEGLDYVVQFTGPTGTNAIEAALKLVRKFTGRTNVIGFTNGFHGVTMGALSLTTNPHFRNASGLPAQGATSLPYDGYFGPGVDTMDYIERLVGSPCSGIDKPAAFFVETIQGEGGLTAAGIGWLQRLAAFCRSQEILLVVDDIQAGCGRSGRFFSFTEAGITPDIVTLSKSLSGLGLPLAVVLMKRECDIWKPGEHNGTFRGNNHAFVTATAALNQYWSDGRFASEIMEKASHLDERLHEIAGKYPQAMPQVRGRGMMKGLLFAEPDEAAAVCALAYREGLIIERSGPRDEVVKFLMPLNTPPEQLDEGLDIIGWAVDTVIGSPGGRTTARRARKSPVRPRPTPLHVAHTSRATRH
nr:diaminobutyrate--2-oxoglutarate transaminase [Hartmannibacter diazotrophicus]